MKVYLTTDVESWPRNWDLSEREMRRAFDRFILGRTAQGDYGLQFQLRMLRDYELKGVFFVEPLFASVMGKSALSDIVAMINDYGQEVQLHAHPEWLGRSRSLERFGEPRLAMSQLDEPGQAAVIGTARHWLEDAGARKISAFRAGSFGADVSTLRALQANGIGVDSSHDPAGPMGPLVADLSDSPAMLEGVLEIPQTVYRDGFRRLRHVQIGSSSIDEIGSLLTGAERQGRKAFVILSHSAELLTRDRDRRDRALVRRFERLCAMLADHSKQWVTSGFDGICADEVVSTTPYDTLGTNMRDTAWRYAEQVVGRLA